MVKEKEMPSVPDPPKTEKETDLYVFGCLCGAHFVYRELGKGDGLDGLISQLERLIELTEPELVVEIANFVKEGMTN